MTTYPVHRAHLRLPHRGPWLVLAIVAVAALVGAGAWALVDHFSGGGSGMSNSQAVTFINTGQGLPGLNKNGGPLPASARPYALGVYRSAPYRARPLNLFYAVGATATHLAPAAADVSGATLMTRTIAAIEADTALFPSGTPRPITTTTLTRYGVTVGQVAEATVVGMLHGQSR